MLWLPPRAPSRPLTGGAIRAQAKRSDTMAIVNRETQIVTSPDGGQASAVEVTPEMIEAGEAVLWRYDPDYSDSAFCVSEIFRAMRAASSVAE